MDENRIVAVYAKQHSKIGNDFINQKISYDEYIKRTNICALYADRKISGRKH